MPQLHYVYFCFQRLEATFLAILAHFTFILFSAKSAVQGLQWKMAFCSLPGEGASCTQLVCSKSETSNISSWKGKSFHTLAEENIADILNRATDTNLLMKFS